MDAICVAYCFFFCHLVLPVPLVQSYHRRETLAVSNREPVSKHQRPGRSQLQPQSQLLVITINFVTEYKTTTVAHNHIALRRVLIVHFFLSKQLHSHSCKVLGKCEQLNDTTNRGNHPVCNIHLILLLRIFVGHPNFHVLTCSFC